MPLAVAKTFQVVGVLESGGPSLQQKKGPHDMEALNWFGVGLLRSEELHSRRRPRLRSLREARCSWLTGRRKTHLIRRC